MAQAKVFDKIQNLPIIKKIKPLSNLGKEKNL